MDSEAVLGTRISEQGVGQSPAQGDDAFPARRLLLAEVAGVVCRVCRISWEDLVSHRRMKDICDARFVYFWISRKYTTHSYPMIARRCGDRDHTTAMHGVSKVDGNFDKYRRTIIRCLVALGLKAEADMWVKA